MHHWDHLVKEVLEKKYRGVANDEQEGRQATDAKKALRAVLPKQRYVLGEDHKLYLTYREAQCMLLFIHGKTVIKAAQCLALSPRTVEYYLNNMKSKLKCRTKSELIELILQTQFLQHAATLRRELSLDKG